MVCYRLGKRVVIFDLCLLIFLKLFFSKMLLSGFMRFLLWLIFGLSGVVFVVCLGW